ncbi:helix-turn-helix domain-containing protein [Amycolatopsis sp. NPDC047767]|uniref:helix-turn-helix domain-containing protein n=1 Tax=Amycolatopsis sp. NPDC047767 TaxID=3156765 RepID=UPI003452D6F0
MSMERSGSEGPRFYTVKAAADLLRVSPMTIYRAVEAGEFPAVRTRGRISIPAKAIDLMEQEAMAGRAVVDSADFSSARASGERLRDVPRHPLRSQGLDLG